MRSDIFSSDLHEEVMREYEKIRSNNKLAWQEIKKQIYTHFPRVEQIDKELDAIAINSCKKILGTDISAEQIMQKMQSDTEKLVNEKTEILKSAGLSPDCMEESYSCFECKDRGWQGDKLCKCYYAKMQKLLIKRANLGTDKVYSFKDYNVNLYSDVKNEKFGFSPRENARDIYDIAVNYCKMEEAAPRQLLLYGGTGLGKTFTSECIASEFIKQGKEVFYTSAPNLFTIFEDYKFGRNTTEEARKIIDYIENADLLIIDDLGTEFRTQYIDSILFNIVNERTKYNKYMIISTNLSPNQLEATYTPRISSRILGNFETVLFFGNDLRVKNQNI